MSDYLPNIGIYSKENKITSLLIEHFKNKGFSTTINPRSISAIDYAVINFASGIELENYKQYLHDIKLKCLVFFENDQRELANNILSLNKNISIGILSSDTGKVYDYSENILKELLSFGHMGYVFNLEGKEIKTEVQEIKTENSQDGKPLINLSKVFVEQKSVIQKHDNQKHKIPVKEKLLKKYELKLKKIKVPYKKIIVVSVLLIILALLPGIALLFSSTSLYLSAKNSITNPAKSEKYIYMSESSANIAKNINFGIPMYKDGYILLNQTVKVLKNINETIDLTKTLTDNITGNKIYDLKDISTKLTAELDSLYTNSSFLKTNIDTTEGLLGNLIKRKMNNEGIDLSKYNNKINSAKEIASNLDSILGSDVAKKYLVLFQNNMELRPTGGFIGSYALLTLDGGRLSEISVSDVYSADGQLKGHVEPPQPIKEILGEGGWYMRDANWDPDFPSSASKIEWFLDKEIDTRVEGVIAIDLYLVQKFLEVTGPLDLTDFDIMVDSDNLYETTQNEVESEFFPGSTKKSSFLTALSRQLINKLENLEDDKKPRILFKLYESLEEKHMQISLHDKNVQSVFSLLNYDGAVNVDISCGERCLWDKYYLVDANLGINKANLYIKRVQDLYLTLNKNNVAHELLVTYTNEALPELGKSGTYKSYTRLVVPKESIITNVRLYKEGGQYQDLEYKTEDLNETKEIGFLIEVLPQSSVQVQLGWKLNSNLLEQGGEYRLRVNKQSGTDADLLGVTMRESDLVPAVTIPAFSLTQQGTSIYNTNLRQSFDAIVFFK